VWLCEVPAVGAGRDGFLPSGPPRPGAPLHRPHSESDTPASTVADRRPVPDRRRRPRAGAPRVAAPRVAARCALPALANSARPRVARTRSCRARASPARSPAGQLTAACFAEAPAHVRRGWGRPVLAGASPRSCLSPHPPAPSLGLGSQRLSPAQAASRAAVPPIRRASVAGHPSLAARRVAGRTSRARVAAASVRSQVAAVAQSTVAPRAHCCRVPAHSGEWARSRGLRP
jgi:hypothetical protein